MERHFLKAGGGLRDKWDAYGDRIVYGNKSSDVAARLALYHAVRSIVEALDALDVERLGRNVRK